MGRNSNGGEKGVRNKGGGDSDVQRKGNVLKDERQSEAKGRER